GADLVALQRDHASVVAALHAAHRGGAEAKRQVPVVGNRGAAALDVAEHERPRLLPTLLFDLRRQPLGDAAVAPRLPHEARLSSCRPSTLGDHHDTEAAAVALPLLDLLDDRPGGVGNLRDDDYIGAP